jgi:hypothetical protein
MLPAESIPSSIASVSGGPSLTDYLTGWGTIALALITVGTVLMALRTTKIDRRRDDERRAEIEERAREERYARQLAQARLVIIGAPEISATSPVRKDLNQHKVQFSFVNYGDQPVIGIEAEVWLKEDPLDNPCSARNQERYLLVKIPKMLEIVINSSASELRLAAWRIRWTDADGYVWCVDQPEQPEPLPYEGGPPRPC